MIKSPPGKTTYSEPGFIHSLTTLVLIIGVISVGLWFHTSLHSLLLICILIASVSVGFLGYKFGAIRQAMNSGIKGALPAIYIFILIGVLIAAFIESGTLATLIYYGIEFVDPVWFLPAGLVLCSFMSIATGTSWGTVGTIGIVLMGIGTAMNIPAPVIAGMVISGACFGDKMSPMSDTTNLSAMSYKTDLYRHIQSMLYTTGPSYLIAFIVFSVIGMEYADSALPVKQLNELQSAISEYFDVSVLTLLPIIVMLGLSIARVSAEPAMMSAAIIAVLLAVSVQGQDFSVVLNSLYSGGTVKTGLDSLDTIFGRGGITSMLWTLSLSILALALGGILESGKLLRVLITAMLIKVKRAAGLVATTILSCVVGNMVMGEAYMSIILGGQLFGDAYDEKGVKRRVMSRSLEEGATLTTALIPWTTGGAFFASTLGVAVLDYAPWALLNWINPLLSIVFAYLGIALFRRPGVSLTENVTNFSRS
ncbi:Na+/H+ antiporter NhaC [Endozoicomonas sp. (ex Bugula neritina AB1)]|nr:Na+/H+ antiporter NhaC [Endozoicomonas sp. (ex Bugula neritina AB1)]